MTALAPARPGRHARSRRFQVILNAGKGVAGILVACVAWEAIRGIGIVDPRDLPALLDIGVAFFGGFQDPKMLEALVATLFAWVVGLALATIVGAILGLLVGLSPLSELLTRPVFEFIRPIPSVALIPVALIVIGLGTNMEVGLIAFASLWPVLFNVKAAVESTDPRFLECGRILGHPRVGRIWRIIIPNTLPSLATGVRTAAAIALVLAITVEMVTGQAGLGQMLQAQRLSGAAVYMWATVFLTGVIGYLVNVVFLIVERRMLVWSADNRVS